LAPIAEYLLLADMNGNLCYRSEVPVGGAKQDLFVRGRKYYYGRRAALASCGTIQIIHHLHSSHAPVYIRTWRPSARD
jgi:hypothetical protein